MTTKLWSSGLSKSPAWLEDFTSGSDRNLDLHLAEFDVIGSIAHAEMLGSSGLISREESAALKTELGAILLTIREGNFRLYDGVEDIHSQIEIMLTEKLGENGKKIHTARSRNDQVLLDIKLYTRAQLKKTTALVSELFELLIEHAEKYRDHLLPGYTHLQAAMPSSFGLWFSAYAESLADDLEFMIAAYKIADRNPLGSGAGYGSSLPIDRELTTQLLNFEGMNYNSVYAQMTRGKTEKAAAIALSMIAATLSKMAMDICLYNSQNFNFVKFPDELTTGSSIMPHKKNPDVFELVRAKCNRIQSAPNELALLLSNLPSGYHRDLQLTKEILFPLFHELNSCLTATVNMLREVQVRENILEEDKYKLLFTVEAVNDLVLKGTSFREAYKEIKKAVDDGSFEYKKKLKHTHTGSINKLALDEIKSLFNEKAAVINMRPGK